MVEYPIFHFPHEDSKMIERKSKFLDVIEELEGAALIAFQMIFWLLTL